MSTDPINETKVVSTKTEERLKWFSEKIRRLLNSDWSFIFFISFFIILTIGQLLYDGLSGNFGEDHQLEVDLLIFAGSVTSIISLIYNARMKSRFFVFLVLSLIFWIWRSILVGLFLNALKLAILFLPSVVRFFRWTRGNKTKNEIEVKRMRIWHFLSILIVLILLVLLLGNFAGSIQGESLPYVDVGNLLFGVTAASIAAFGFLEGWFLTIFSLSFGIASYILLATNGAPLSINGIIPAFVFMSLNVGTAFAWLSIYHGRNHTFKYIPKSERIQKAI